MRARTGVISNRSIAPVEPGRDGRAGHRRKCAPAGRATRTGRTERPARSMMKGHGRLGVERRVARRTCIQGRCKTKSGDKMPEPRHRRLGDLLRCGLADFIERTLGGLKDATRVVLLSEAHTDFGERFRSPKSTQRRAQLWPRSRGVECVQRVQVTRRMHRELRDATREQIESAAELALGTSRATRNRGDDPGITRRQPHDARCLSVVKRMQDDGVGRENAHDRKLA